MWLPLTSLLLFGITIASSHLEDLHKDAERLDTASRTSRPTRIRRGEQSLSSDPFQAFHDFMLRSDDEGNFDNLLQHGPSDFILRHLQMLDFNRDIVSFMAKSENENEHPGKGMLDKIIRFGDTMKNKITDSFGKHERYRRGAKGGPAHHNYDYPVINNGPPEYIAAPQNSYPYHHCYILAPQFSEDDHSSKGGHHSSKYNHDDHGDNHLVICEIPVNSCPCHATPHEEEPDDVFDEHEDIYDIHDTKVNVTVTEDEPYMNGKDEYESQPSNGHQNNGNSNGKNGNNGSPFFPFEMPETNDEVGELLFG